MTEPVHIYTITGHRPEFIAKQFNSLRAHLKEPFKLHVVANTADYATRQQIVDACLPEICNCYIMDNPNLRSANWMHASALQWAWQEIIWPLQHEHVAIIDSDMFLARPYSIDATLGNALFAGLPQSRDRIAYFWPGLMLLRPTAMPDSKGIDFQCGHVDGIGVDVGGMLYHYFSSHPNVPVKPLGERSLDNQANNLPAFESLRDDIRARYRIEWASQTLDDAWFHYRGGSNWDAKSSDHHRDKTSFLDWLLEEQSANGGKELFK